MALRAVTQTGGGGGSISLSALSVAANNTNTTANAASVGVGDNLNSGIFFGTLGTLVATPSPEYHLNLTADSRGLLGTTIVGANQPYYVASRVPITTTQTTVVGTLTGTSLTTIARFITPLGDPGTNSFEAGNLQHRLYFSSSDATAQFTVTVNSQRIALDGTLVGLGSATSATVSGATGVTAVLVNFRKQTASPMDPTDCILYTVQATRVAGTASFPITFTSDGGGANRSTVFCTVPGVSQPPPGYVLNVKDFGAKGDMLTYVDGHITNGNGTLTSASASFGPWDVGKNIVIDGAGAGGIGTPPFASTIATYIDANTVVCTGTAGSTTAGVQVLAGAAVSFGGSAGYYAPGDTATLLLGTFTTAGVVNVTATTIRPDTDSQPALTINNPGSLGVDGTFFFGGTTGTGTRLRALVTISGGVAVGIALGNGGLYVSNPGTTAEPLTSTVSPLTGLTVAINGIDARLVGVTTPGSYTVLPPDPTDTAAASPSGATGMQLSPTTFVGSGRFVYFTNDLAAINKVIAYCNTQFGKGQRVPIEVPGGIYGITGGALTIASCPLFWRGAGWKQSIFYAAEGYTGAFLLAWDNLFPLSNMEPVSGPNTLLSQDPRGAGAEFMWCASDLTNTVPVGGFGIYGRNDGFVFDHIGGDNLPNGGIRTGLINGNESQAFLRESELTNSRWQSCGSSSVPVVWFDSLGAASGFNEFFLNYLAIVFPVGEGLVIDDHAQKRDAAKTIFGGNIRIERSPSSVNPTGALMRFNSFNALSGITNVNLSIVHLIAPQANSAALQFLGPTELIRPHDITISGLLITGPSLGIGVDIQAGYNIDLEADQISGRTTMIQTGNHGPYRKTTTAGVGSTSSTVVTAVGPAVDNGNVGSAVVMSVAASFTATITGTSMNVTAVASGRILVGTVINGGGIIPTQIVTALGTGTGGTGTYTLSNSNTLTSRALTGAYSETRNVVSYVASTKTSTIGALQGSAATWSNTPANGDVISFQSLVDKFLKLSADGDEANYTFSDGVGVDALWTTPLLVSGVPTGARTFPASVNFPVATALTATGTVQGDSLLLGLPTSIVSTVAAGTGVRLPPWVANGSYKVLCRGANNLNVYPSGSDQIEALGASNPAVIVPTGDAQFTADTTGLWRASS